MRDLHQRGTAKFQSLELQDLLVSSTFVLREEMVQERGFDASTESGGEWGTAATETMALPWMQSAQD